VIVCLSESGNSARYLAKYKPAMPVITLTPDEQTARQCMVSRALYPIVVKREEEDKLLQIAIELGYKENWLSKGSPVVMVTGMNMGVSGSTNTLRIMDA